MTEKDADAEYYSIRQKIILIGNVHVGKTSIINSLTGQKFIDDYEPSIGVDFFAKVIKYKGKEIKLQFWDSAGQERFKSLIPNYIRGSSLIFLVYDITNKQSFLDLPKWISFINDIEPANIILIGNKIDLKDQRVITYEEGTKFANENKCPFYEISVKEDKNILNMLYGAVSELPVFQHVTERTTKEEIINDLAIENSEANNTDISNQINHINSNIINPNLIVSDNFSKAGGQGYIPDNNIANNSLIQQHSKKKCSC